MRIIVTGGNGFIGRCLVNALSRENYDVNVLSRCSHGEISSGVNIVKGDLTSGDCPLHKLLEGCKVIFHCAGEIHNIADMRALHVDGTQRLIHAALQEAKRKKQNIHWVQLSSVGAYGPVQGSAHTERIVTEDTPVRPIGEYEITKTLSDELVMQAGRSGLMSYSIVRPSNVVGSDMPNESVRSLGRMVKKGLFFYIGRPGAIATYVHVDDVVEVLMRCGFDQRAYGNIFNISNDCFLEEMIEGMAQAFAVKPPKLRLPETLLRATMRVADKVVSLPLTQERINALVVRTRYPYSKLQRELNFVPRKSVPNTIAEVVLSPSGPS